MWVWGYSLVSNMYKAQDQFSAPTPHTELIFLMCMYSECQYCAVLGVKCCVLHWSSFLIPMLLFFACLCCPVYRWELEVRSDTLAHTLRLCRRPSRLRAALTPNHPSLHCFLLFAACSFSHCFGFCSLVFTGVVFCRITSTSSYLPRLFSIFF